MNCVSCNAEMSAGDVTFEFEKDDWVVMCPECEAIQPYKVSFVGGVVLIDTEGGAE